MKKILLLLFTGISLVACSSANESETKLSEEEQKYIALLESEKYQEVMSEIGKIEDDFERTYFKLAMAFAEQKNAYEYLYELYPSGTDQDGDYSMYDKVASGFRMAKLRFDDVKNVPKQLEVVHQQSIAELSEKEKYYQNLYDEWSALSIPEQFNEYSIYSEKNKVDPAIGMTADELLISTWGEPSDINKTTTTSSVREKWVYHGSRYIYLDDGYVSTIQE